MKINNLITTLLVLLLFSVATAKAANDYPATDFQPKVVYQDQDYEPSNNSGSSSKSVADSDHPAANFQPKTIYQDKSYKHPKKKQYNSPNPVTPKSSDTTEESSSNIMLGLILVAIAGFILYKKGNQPTSQKGSAGRRVVANNGSSGVARYLESKAGPLLSGVGRYLEGRENAVASGVAKYVAKQKVLNGQAKANNASGVDKYLKDRS